MSAALPAALVLVAGLVVSVEALARELAALREENADLRRQLGRHSGNSGQPPSQDGPAAPPRTAAGTPARRQVHDLPVPPPLEVTEHRAQVVSGLDSP